MNEPKKCEICGATIIVRHNAMSQQQIDKFGVHEPVIKRNELSEDIELPGLTQQARHKAAWGEYSLALAEREAQLESSLAEMAKLRALLTKIKIQTESNQLVNESILRRIKDVAPTLRAEEKK